MNEQAEGKAGDGDRLRVAFCWAEVSGYMAACFRELMARPGVSARFITFASGRTGSSARFADDLTAELPCRLLEPNERDDAALIRREVLEHRPDVVVLCGWFHGPYRQLLTDPAFAAMRLVMAMDTPWWGRPRQWIGRIALRRSLRRLDHMVVTGERAWQYAIRLGIPESKISRGMYGIDHRGLADCLRKRTAGDAPWPRRFLFAGRYAREKGIDLLIEAYRGYRSAFAADGDGPPWPLVCCGAGPQGDRLANIPGVEDRGFVQPSELRDEFSAAGAFVLPSRFDPWPLALVEACAAGLPVIATEACGSAVELIRPEYNGYLVATEDVAALADAMLRVHREHDQLALYGERACRFAEAYSVQAWADRWERIFTRLNQTHF